jgi:hypothetical protein
LQPDDVRVELVTAWKKQSPSVALRAFLDVIYEKLPFIRQKAATPLNKLAFTASPNSRF